MSFKDYLNEQLTLVEDTKPSYGSFEDKNYVVKINKLSSNDFYSQPFGRSMADRKLVKSFIEDSETKTTHIDAKGKSTLSSVKLWIKENKPSEFYATWKKDSSNYKDDSVKLFYK